MVITHGESKFTYNLHKTLGGAPQRRLWYHLSLSSLMKAHRNTNLPKRLFLEREGTHSSCHQKLRGIHRRFISLENTVSAELERIKMTGKAMRLRREA